MLDLLQAVYRCQGDVFLLSDSKQILKEKEGESLLCGRKSSGLAQTMSCITVNVLHTLQSFDPLDGDLKYSSGGAKH